MPDFSSPNFDFLSNLDPALMHQAVLAERYCLDDPNAALIKLRLFGELLAKNIAARFGVYADTQFQQIDILKELKYRDVLDQKLSDMFHRIRIVGNAAVHEGKGTVRDALQDLRLAHQLAVYFYRVFKTPKFKSGPFQVPPNPSNVTEALQNDLETARNQILELQGQIEYHGIINSLEASYGFLFRDEFQDRIFTHKYHSKEYWHDLSFHKRVIFNLAFNYRGPIAINIRPEAQ